jgi:ABC-type transport system substrate-binding protein
VRQKPFDDVRVRQAVCWAIDHRAVLKAISGVGEVAGEFLPPGMPGVRRLGRYLGPDGGPDIVKARALLREAGYPNGFSTKLYGMTPEPVPRMLTLIQQNLADVGIRAELDLGEAVAYTGMAENVSNHVPFGYYAWYADYVDPSNFFDVLLNGERIQPTNNLDLSMFDDHGINAAIHRAMAATGDSTRARLWHQIDERVMDAAPVVCLVHRYDDRLYSPRIGGWYRHITRILKIDRLYVKQPIEHPIAERR